MFWFNVCKMVPAFTGQIVNMKVADYAGNYKTKGWYDFKREEWFTIEGINVHDNVYAWKLIRNGNILTFDERQAKMAKWE